MPRLVFLDSAKRELGEIAEYIEGESQNRAVAEGFVDRLIGYCQRIASLESAVGRARPELLPDIRSITFGSYVLFLRYLGEDGDPRAILQIVHILHGARDLDAYFSEMYRDESE